MKDHGTGLTGRIAAITVASLTALFAVFLVVALRFPEANYISYIVCFFLAPAYVVMIACLHSFVPKEKQVFTRVALSFSVIYAVFTTMTYYVQLVFVRPNFMIMPQELLRIFFYTPGTFIFTLDMLGYAFLCLSTLSASFTFEGKSNKLIRIFYMVNGALFVPTLIFPALPFAQDTGATAPPSDIFGTFALLFWCFIFVPLSFMTAGYFKRSKEQ